MSIFNFLNKKKKPEYPYESFFFDFEKLGERPSPAKVNKAYPEGGLRLKTFEHLKETYPDDVRYIRCYLESYARAGVYDDQDFEHCFTLIRHGLSLQDKSSSHAKLRKLKDQLEKQLHEILEELGSDHIGTCEPSELTLLQRSGHHKIIEAFESVHNSHQPKGILGGDSDRRFWYLYQMAIESYLDKQDYKQALSLMEEYETKRIKVGLTPIPDYNLQKKIIGCLAQINPSLAIKKLRYWLANSKSPCICDTIKHHKAFITLFTQD
ncbi:MAG: hypothetical protein GY757_44290 [bacterium]|nr:hypothetical protein [bacterium]